MISREPEKWKYFKENLLSSYEFVFSKPDEKWNFFGITIVAVDEIETMQDIANKANTKKRCPPIVFFGNSGDLSMEIQARKLGAVDFFSVPFDNDLLYFRFKNVSEMSKFISWTRQINREMVNLQEDMAQTMAQTVESRDENTGGHIIRTSTFIGILGEEFINTGDLTRDQLALIVRAAPLHDIGKIGVQDSVLLKPGPLTDSEREEMKKHAEKGAELIKKMQRKFESHTYLSYAYDIALNHHEFFNGKGYPNGKKGLEIPFWARLMSVVDVYDALVSDRIYRKGMQREDAFKIIFGGEGTQFDPVVLKAFDNCKDFMV